MLEIVGVHSNRTSRASLICGSMRANDGEAQVEAVEFDSTYQEATASRLLGFATARRRRSLRACLSPCGCGGSGVPSGESPFRRLLESAVFRREILLPLPQVRQ